MKHEASDLGFPVRPIQWFHGFRFDGIHPGCQHTTPEHLGKIYSGGGCYKRADIFRHDETGADIYPKVPTLQESDSTYTPYMHIDLNRYKSTCTLTHNAPHAYILTHLHACFSFRRMSPGNDAINSSVVSWDQSPSIKFHVFFFSYVTDVRTRTCCPSTTKHLCKISSRMRNYFNGEFSPQL